MMILTAFGTLITAKTAHRAAWRYFAYSVRPDSL